MIPYLGIIHPILEQAHWAPLRNQTRLAHPLFAGYHMLVLMSLLPAIWLAICFTVLMTASILWNVMASRTQSRVIPIVSHILADLGLIVAAWLRV